MSGTKCSIHDGLKGGELSGIFTSLVLDDIPLLMQLSLELATLGGGSSHLKNSSSSIVSASNTECSDYHFFSFQLIPSGTQLNNSSALPGLSIHRSYYCPFLFFSTMSSCPFLPSRGLMTHQYNHFLEYTPSSFLSCLAKSQR